MDKQRNHILMSMITPHWLRVLPLLALPFFLAACDGPATQANPFTDSGVSQDQSPQARDGKVKAFKVNLWNNLNAENRCGQCHSSQSSAPQEPLFADITNVNTSYDALVGYSKPLVKLDDPSGSFLVKKVGTGHNCWLSKDSAQVCADTIKNMISRWASGDENIVSTEVKLTAPDIKNPGASKNFPATANDNGANSFANTVHPLLEQHCIGCHYEDGAQQQQSPFFANPDVGSAYEAVKPKINIDLPHDSRLVQRLLDGHNCWSECGSYDAATDTATGNAGKMLAAIKQFAGGIQPTTIDAQLITSKALVLSKDGIIATGGIRYEFGQIALWEFKKGKGKIAYDTSGLEPAINLSLEGQYEWLGGYGLYFYGGKAQADIINSKKLYDLIKLSGEYSIEAWVIPDNVTQEDANIISYDAGSMNKNFALAQNLYNYDFHNRSDQSDANGEPMLHTPDADEVLQASLQHVVATYDPIAGRKLYVNGALIEATDPITVSTSISSWDPSFAFVMGQSAANSKIWDGKIRMAAIHNEALSAAAVKQNFDVGVGQKYFLLFSIADQIGIPDSYIRFEVSQFDSYSYLFNEPTFINLDPDWTPTGFTIQKMRIGINGKEAVAGQSFANLNSAVDPAIYSASSGQQLSSHGAVIALEKGPDSDEFFLTFEVLADKHHAHVDPAPTPPPAPADADPVSDIGVRTFDEINATIAQLTGIPVSNPAVKALFEQYKQQLPTVETIDAFLASHQMAIAQLALTSCSERVNADKNLPPAQRLLFTNVDFTESAQTAFDSAAKRSHVIDPILQRLLPNGVASLPDKTAVADLLGAPTPQTLTDSNGSYQFDSLITEMTRCPAPGDAHYKKDFPCSLANDINTAARTAQIVKAVCAAAVGSAAMLIQ